MIVKNTVETIKGNILIASTLNTNRYVTSPLWSRLRIRKTQLIHYCL